MDTIAAAGSTIGNLGRGSLSNGCALSNQNVADNKILVLFDLNGVLTDHTPASGRFRVR
jgi:hypothetical protein